MPEFVWDPLSFLETLGVTPVEDEQGICYRYKVPRQGVTLELTVWPLDGDVCIELTCAQQPQPLLKVNLLSCPSARVLRDRRGQYVEFAATKAFAGRYDETSAAPYGFRLWLAPFVQIEPFSYPV
jgi:hypothetical protein